MTLTQELRDSFNDDTVDPVKWPNNYNTGGGGLPTETGGRARVPCDTGFAAYASDTAGLSASTTKPSVEKAKNAAANNSSRARKGAVVRKRLSFGLVKLFPQ